MRNSRWCFHRLAGLGNPLIHFQRVTTVITAIGTAGILVNSPTSLMMTETAYLPRGFSPCTATKGTCQRMAQGLDMCPPSKCLAAESDGLKPKPSPLKSKAAIPTHD